MKKIGILVALVMVLVMMTACTKDVYFKLPEKNDTVQSESKIDKEVTIIQHDTYDEISKEETEDDVDDSWDNAIDEGFEYLTKEVPEVSEKIADGMTLLYDSTKNYDGCKWYIYYLACENGEYYIWQYYYAWNNDNEVICYDSLNDTWREVAVR